VVSRGLQDRVLREVAPCWRTPLLYGLSPPTVVARPDLPMPAHLPWCGRVSSGMTFFVVYNTTCVRFRSGSPSAPIVVTPEAPSQGRAPVVGQDVSG
jgi:hypothetical protein